MEIECLYCGRKFNLTNATIVIRIEELCKSEATFGGDDRSVVIDLGKRKITIYASERDFYGECETISEELRIVCPYCSEEIDPDDIDFEFDIRIES